MDGWVGIINLYVPVKFNNVFITLSSIYICSTYSKKEYNLLMAWLTYLDVLLFFGSTILFWLLDIINSMFAEIESNFTEQHLRVLKCLSVCPSTSYMCGILRGSFVWTQELECINWHWTEIIALIKTNCIKSSPASQHRLTSWYVWISVYYASNNLGVPVLAKAELGQVERITTTKTEKTTTNMYRYKWEEFNKINRYGFCRSKSKVIGVSVNENECMKNNKGNRQWKRFLGAKIYLQTLVQGYLKVQNNEMHEILHLF